MGNSLKRVKLGNSLGNSLTATKGLALARKLGNSLAATGVLSAVAHVAHRLF